MSENECMREKEREKKIRRKDKKRDNGAIS